MVRHADATPGAGISIGWGKKICDCGMAIFSHRRPTWLSMTLKQPVLLSVYI
jgi:hypothetical protein